MIYCTIDEQQKRHLIDLMKFIAEEVLSAGGDGDALWYSKFYNVKDLLPLIRIVDEEFKLHWEIKLEDGTISWGDNQEWIIITNNEEQYNRSPNWQQLRIRY